jgi:hypothetical protein
VSIVQSDATNITDTVNSIELGDNQSVVGQSYAGLTNPKYFSLDTTKYDGTVSAQFEASMLGGQGASGTQAVFMSGFETGNCIEWTSGCASANTAQKRSGDYSSYIPSGLSSNWRDDAASANIGVRFGVRFADSTPASNEGFFNVESTTTHNWDVYILTDGKMRVQNLGNSTNYDSAGTVFSDATWHLIEFKGNVHDTTGSFGLKVDGTEVITQSNIDTNNAVTTVNRIGIGGITGGDWVDDVYRINSNTYPGDGKIVALQPSALGDFNEWDTYSPNASPNQYNNWNETPTDNDTSFNSNTTNPGSFVRELHNVEDASTAGNGSNDTINTVVFSIWAKRGTGGGTSFSIVRKWGDGTGSSSFSPTTSYGYFTWYTTTNLTVTNVDNAQVGASHQGAQDITVSTAWVMVDYTPQTTMKARLEQCDEASCSWTAVTSGELTTTSTSWSLAQSGDIWGNLTTGRIYRVAVDIDGSYNAQKIASAKLVIKQTASGGITKFQTVQQYNNTLATRSASSYASQDAANRFDKQNNWIGGTFAAYFETTIKTSNGANAYFAQLNTPLGEVTASDTSYTRKRNATDLWGSLPSTATDIEVQLKNNSTDTTSSSTSWLIIEVSNLQIPENLWLFLPVVLFLPSLIQWWRRRNGFVNGYLPLCRLSTAGGSFV